ncbi:MAG: hypothetical protein KDB65_00725 [Calditrichaeota bacterium]|nr:hypothetical protein [Calditrichota bacterium]MCB9369260.1 hypothetical protein [Calditrichota bacterium]
MKSLIEIPQATPFDNDKLDREKYADVLTQILSTHQTPLVISVDAAWGYGKTTFVRMWLQKMRNQGKVCIYYSAWENDYADDPLSSIVSEITSEIEKEKDGLSNRTELVKNLKVIGNAATKVAVRSIPALTRLLTAGLLNIDGIADEVKAGIRDTLPDVAATSMDVVREHEARKSAINEFKESLSIIVKEIQERDGHESGSALTIVIDELDRCRPPYAVATLERVKHLFDIPGITFVLVIHTTQIHHSLQMLYGPALDAEVYLRRILDIRYKLPEPSRESFIDFMIQRFSLDDYFDSRASLLRKDANEKELFRALAQTIARSSKLSLRDLEQLFNFTSFVLLSDEDRRNYSPEAILLLVAMKLFDTNRYDELRWDYGDGGAVRKFALQKGAISSSPKQDIIPELEMITRFWLSDDDPNRYYLEMRHQVEILGSGNPGQKRAMLWANSRIGLTKKGRKWYMDRIDMFDGFQSLAH